MKYIGFMNEDGERLDIYKNGSEGVMLEITDSAGDPSLYRFADIEDVINLIIELQELVSEIENIK